MVTSQSHLFPYDLASSPFISSGEQDLYLTAESGAMLEQFFFPVYKLLKVGAGLARDGPPNGTLGHVQV